MTKVIKQLNPKPLIGHLLQVPKISFDAIYETRAGAWALNINGTQLPVTYRSAHPTYRNTSIPGEARPSKHAAVSGMPNAMPQGSNRRGQN